MNRELIEQFLVGGVELRRAVQGLSPDDCAARPGPGAWSIQELVIHLADSDAIAIDRMKRIIAEENPMLLYADDSAYVRELHCDSQSLEDAVSLVEIGRRQFARVLRCLPDSAFERSGTHNIRGPVTLGQLVADYVEHLEHHLKFLHGKRERLGKPLDSQPSA